MFELKALFLSSLHERFPIFVIYLLPLHCNIFLPQRHHKQQCVRPFFKKFGFFFLSSVQVLLKLWRNPCFIYSVCLPQSRSVLGEDWCRSPISPDPLVYYTHKMIKSTHTEHNSLFCCSSRQSAAFESWSSWTLWVHKRVVRIYEMALFMVKWCYLH